MPITLNPDVQSLILKYNKFKTVDASISFYPSLVHLDKSNNELEIWQSFHCSTCSGHCSYSLDISENMISKIESTSSENFVNLRVLKLENDNLVTVPSESLSSMIKLVQLRKHYHCNFLSCSTITFLVLYLKLSILRSFSWGEIH